MFSLLAIVTTVLVLGAALLWRAVRSLPLARAAPVALWRGAATLIRRLFSVRASVGTAGKRQAHPR